MLPRTACAVAAALTLGVAGCGDSPATSTVDTRTTVAAHPKPKADTDARIVRELRRYMKRNFGPATGLTVSWYSSIKKYTSNDGDVSVATDIYPDSDAPPLGQSICAAIIGATVPDDDPTVEGLTGARVLDSTGGIIKRCERAGATRWE